MKPIFVDFVPPVTSRLGQRIGQPDLLLKAVNGVQDSVVYDFTAGLGQDSRLMALAGAARVHMIERDPIVAALLEDALRRLLVLSEKVENNSALKNAATNLYNCLSLECADAVETIDRKSSDLQWPPDIVYLDPMFPARKKSASVKKNMQVLHSLLGSQVIDDAVADKQHSVLLRTAYTVTKSRAVVKRPINAPFLLPVEELRPSYSMTGSINRWDVYVKS
jgi:16S rRNA (guanine1516-N2)-methyltransferase